MYLVEKNTFIFITYIKVGIRNFRINFIGLKFNLNKNIMYYSTLHVWNMYIRERMQ